MKTHFFTRVASILSLGACAFSQELPPLLVSDGALLGERRGYAVADAGDLDGDGLSETWVGSPFESTSAMQAGCVRALSGATGLALHTMYGPAAMDHFGWSLAALPDVDGDGVPDLAAGAPTSDLQTLDGGAVLVISGASGTTLFYVPGFVPGAQLGTSLCYLGDVNGDGFADLASGAPFDDTAGTDAGSVALHSASTGALIRRHFGSAPGDRLGVSVAGAGDVDLDARPDVLVGADQDGVACGYAEIYSGRTGGSLRTLSGAGALERFGCAVAGCGDFDGDGVADAFVGASAAWVQGSPTGAVRVFSGASGQLVSETLGTGPGEMFGSAVCAFPDLDGDGRAEILASGWFEGGASGAAGVVRAISSCSGRPIQAWRGRAGGDRFGFAIAAAGDRDGDGRADLICGAPRDDAPLIDSGTLFVLSTRSSAPQVYCDAKANSQGCLPCIGATGFASWSDQSSLVISVTKVLNQKSGLYFFGTARAAIPFRGGTLCIAAPIQRSHAVHSGGASGANDCSGKLDLAISGAFLQSQGWSPGTLVETQAWYRDPQHPDGSASGLSDALEFAVHL